jgi:ankyrin repeat protein
MADQPEVIALLVSAGADPDTRMESITSLMLAAQSASAETVTALLDGGADPSLQNPQHWGQSAIHYAAENGNIAALEVLVDRGSPVDLRDLTQTTPLMYAAQTGDAEAVRWLLDHGADPALVDDNPSTARDWAASLGLTEIVDILDAAAAGN